jgi:hypothetical protein
MLPPTASPHVLAKHLRALVAERALAADPAILAELDEEIAGCRAAYVGAAVTRIAVARAAGAGRLWG